MSLDGVSAGFSSGFPQPKSSRTAIMKTERKERIVHPTPCVPDYKERVSDARSPVGYFAAGASGAGCGVPFFSTGLPAAVQAFMPPSKLNTRSNPSVPINSAAFADRPPAAQ